MAFQKSIISLRVFPANLQQPSNALPYLSVEIISIPLSTHEFSEFCVDLPNLLDNSSTFFMFSMRIALLLRLVSVRMGLLSVDFYTRCTRCHSVRLDDTMSSFIDLSDEIEV